ncbi:MRN complex-interacting protein [Benincasa hispida]|uniref:MRN complex-interacting protein n=1 Tax=Benincasa hispida TaxID=102211 RepID=UPI0019006534|nr:MRN complex-interacting protein [Benincasa hispida]
MATIFIAVQCFQCSTMQVKQQRKSGNRWICAVCNEKQSLQKVFARASMAKDVRKFVQNFNMSRKYADEQAKADELLDGGIVDEDKLDCSARRKRRNDWSEYLDPEEDRSHNGRENEGELESESTDEKIVTEIPEVKTRKSGSTSCSRWSEGEGDGFYRPIFSKRKHIANNLSSQDEVRNWESTSTIQTMKWSKGNDEQIISKAKNLSAPFQDKKMSKNSHKIADEIQNWELQSEIEASKGSKDMSKDDENSRTKTSILAKVRGPSSKWSEYITEEDNCRGRNGENMATDQCIDILKKIINDEIVDDDIHPDFK